ncbi:MAG: hypothetical protein ACI9SC_000368 [Gammaproteobacteria bacterium]|jgi:hypothetical protein
MKKNYSLFVFLLLFYGCGSPDTSLFPLSEGYWWQYSAIKSLKGESHIQKLVLANLPAVKVDDTKLYPRKRADGRIDYFEKTEKGVFRVDLEDGSKTPILQEPIVLGSKWQATSKILFLEVTGAFEATYNGRIKEDITIDYEIDSIDEVVKVAAGRFTNCVRVKGFGTLYGGGGQLKEFMNIDSINIETLDWYAPGVGLIKRTRKEYTYPLDFKNHYSEELESFRKG